MWRCNGSSRSSFASTINVLEGLLEFERVTGGTPESRDARRSGEEYLLARRLFRRASTGEPADGAKRIGSKRVNQTSESTSATP